jgi:putative membrane protein
VFRRTGGLLMRPPVALALQSAAIGIWHIPVLYDAAVRSEWVHVFEHVCFVAPALVFWGALLDAPPVRARIDHLHRSIWFAVAMVPGWILAIVLAFANAPVYRAYPSLTDQQLAAGIMWVPGSIAYFVAAFAAFYRWLEPTVAEPRPEELSWT